MWRIPAGVDAALLLARDPYLPIPQSRLARRKIFDTPPAGHVPGFRLEPETPGRSLGARELRWLAPPQAARLFALPLQPLARAASRPPPPPPSSPQLREIAHGFAADTAKRKTVFHHTFGKGAAAANREVVQGRMRSIMVRAHAAIVRKAVVAARACPPNTQKKAGPRLELNIT